MTKFTMRKIAAIVALALPLTAFAGGGATGGATLPEQLVQESTLSNQLGQQSAMVNEQLQTVYNQLYNMQQLNPAAILQMTGMPLQSLGQLVGLMQAVQQSQYAYMGLSTQLNNFTAMSNQMGMQPQQFLQLQAQAAIARGGVYQQIYDQQTQAIQAAQTASANLQQQADSIPGITGSVGGLQNLMSQNVQMQSQMISLNQAMHQNLQLAAEQQATASAAQANQANAQQEQDLYNQAQYQALTNVYQQIQGNNQGQSLPPPANYYPGGAGGSGPLSAIGGLP